MNGLSVVTLFNVPTLVAFSTIMWFMATCSFTLLYFMYKDHMLGKMATAFGLIFVGRVVFNYTDLVYKAEISMTIRAVASYFLIIAALNGQRRNRHTDWWLGATLVVAVFSQWYDTLILHPQDFPMPLSIGPISGAIALGWLFGAWKFLFDSPTRYAKCISYKALGTLFFIRGILAILGSNSLITGTTLLYIAVADVISLSVLVILGIWFSFERHRVDMDCDLEF
jgi:hypothetical protein